MFAMADQMAELNVLILVRKLVDTLGDDRS